MEEIRKKIVNLRKDLDESRENCEKANSEIKRRDQKILEVNLHTVCSYILAVGG